MKVILVLACVLVAANAGVLVRTPSLDSAVIQSERLGGNFAYSSVEGHAYAHIAPVVQNVVQPVGVSYTAHHTPYTAYTTQDIATPVLARATYAAPYAAPYAHAGLAGPLLW